MLEAQTNEQFPLEFATSFPKNSEA